MLSLLDRQNSKMNTMSCYGVTPSKKSWTQARYDQIPLGSRSVTLRYISMVSTFSAVDQQLGITPSVTSIYEENDKKSSADFQNPTKAAAPERHLWSWELQPRFSTTINEKSSAT